MSLPCDTLCDIPPLTLHPPITQRNLEAEVAPCVGVVLSPLLANIALSVLDEHLHAPWLPGGTMHTSYQRHRRQRDGLPNWRTVRYADDFIVMVKGSREDVQALQQEITHVLAPMGLRLSPAKTRIAHMESGFDYLGFHIQWRRKRGTANQWHVYTFIADRPIRQLKDKIRALTPRTSQANPRDLLIRLNQIMHGWANHFKHAVAKHTFCTLARFAWQRVIRWFMTLRRWKWKDVRKWLLGPDGTWLPIHAEGIELINLASKPAITRYRYRGNTIPNPWTKP